MTSRGTDSSEAVPGRTDPSKLERAPTIPFIQDADAADAGSTFELPGGFHPGMAKSLLPPGPPANQWSVLKRNTAGKDFHQQKMTFSLEILAHRLKWHASSQSLKPVLSRNGPQTCFIMGEGMTELVPALLLPGDLLGSK